MNSNPNQTLDVSYHLLQKFSSLNSPPILTIKHTILQYYVHYFKVCVCPPCPEAMSYSWQDTYFHHLEHIKAIEQTPDRTCVQTTDTSHRQAMCLKYIHGSCVPGSLSFLQATSDPVLANAETSAYRQLTFQLASSIKQKISQPHPCCRLQSS